MWFKDKIRYYTTMKEQLIMTYYIYKLECNDPLPDDQIYYGSTACLRTRKTLHKSDCNNVNGKSYNQKKYEIIRLNGGWSNWNMVPIEELPNHTKLQATIREQHWIALNKSNLNSNNAHGRDIVAYAANRQEYRDTHKEERKQYDKEYRQENKEEIRERKKEYNQKHREHKNEYDKQYRHNNQDKLREKTNCQCGGGYRCHGKARHLRTKLHMRYLSGISVKEDFSLDNVMDVTP